jgi:hypothetical protein
MTVRPQTKRQEPDKLFPSSLLQHDTRLRFVILPSFPYLIRNSSKLSIFLRITIRNSSKLSIFFCVIKTALATEVVSDTRQ